MISVVVVVVVPVLKCTLFIRTSKIEVQAGCFLNFPQILRLNCS